MKKLWCDIQLFFTGLYIKIFIKSYNQNFINNVEKFATLLTEADFNQSYFANKTQKNLLKEMIKIYFHFDADEYQGFHNSNKDYSFIEAFQLSIEDKIRLLKAFYIILCEYNRLDGLMIKFIRKYKIDKNGYNDKYFKGNKALYFKTMNGTRNDYHQFARNIVRWFYGIAHYTTIEAEMEINKEFANSFCSEHTRLGLLVFSTIGQLKMNGVHLKTNNVMDIMSNEIPLFSKFLVASENQNKLQLISRFSSPNLLDEFQKFLKLLPPKDIYIEHNYFSPSVLIELLRYNKTTDNFNLDFLMKFLSLTNGHLMRYFLNVSNVVDNKKSEVKEGQELLEDLILNYKDFQGLEILYQCIFGHNRYLRQTNIKEKFFVSTMQNINSLAEKARIKFGIKKDKTTHYFKFVGAVGNLNGRFIPYTLCIAKDFKIRGFYGQTPRPKGRGLVNPKLLPNLFKR